MKHIRVILADDHAVLRIGIRNLLSHSPDIEVIGEAGDGFEALRLVNELNPDVLLLDMEMPGMDGVEVARQLRMRVSPVRILALSAYNDRQYILSMLDQGASGYLIKDEAPGTIVEAVRSVAKGERGWFSRKVAARMAG
ncbi:MAG TPA: response regulator transcription factor [Anaerolineaceae bacterium]|nr:response regulator transcription factor [Anaerolineaceae bacterium]